MRIAQWCVHVQFVAFLFPGQNLDPGITTERMNVSFFNPQWFREGPGPHWLSLDDSNWWNGVLGSCRDNLGVK